MKNELQYLSKIERKVVNSFVKELEENLGDYTRRVFPLLVQFL